MMDDIISWFTHWLWFAAALVLAGLEIAVPGAFLIWLAGAALVTAILTMTLGIGWELQLVVFAILAIVSVLSGREWLRRHPPQSADPALNRRGDRMVGTVVTVIEPFVHGEGRVQIGDSPWSATGPNLAKGSRARIVAVDGSRVTVVAA